MNQEISDALNKFSLKRPLVLESTLVNIDNDLHFIVDADGKKYVVREAKRVKEKDPEFEAGLLSVLAHNSLGVPKAMVSIDGSPYIKTSEGWPVFVFEFIDGVQYEPSDIQKSPKLAYLGGNALGKIHLVSIANKGLIGTNSERDVFTEIDSLLRRDTSEISFIAGFVEFKNELETFREEALSWISANPQSCGAIHSDYGPQNTVFNGDICNIIDFDWACNGPTLKDVGQGVALWSEPLKSATWDNEVAREFIRGYNEIAHRQVNFDGELAFWACFSCLSDACTFFHAFLDGQYRDTPLVAVSQCHGYKRYLYYKKFLDAAQLA
jgi:Ser/Thr protein kinase RdoA (MazF antagonist)